MTLAEWLLFIVVAYGLYRLLGGFRRRLEDRLARLFGAKGSRENGRVIHLSKDDRPKKE